MKINQIIREKRRELSMTQEQLAERLGVTAPAVNKWEKGSSYPDITILPALARLLKTDLNTLLSFNEDLSDVEVANFINELDALLQSQGYEAAYEKAMDKIHQYPNCGGLIFSAVTYLDGMLFFYCAGSEEQYRQIFEKFYRQLADNEDNEIKYTSLNMLINYARNRGEFSKAEELIQSLPSVPLDKDEQLAILYRQQGKRDEALKIWQQRLIKSITGIQISLMNMMDQALLEKRQEDAELFAALYENLVSSFCLPEWVRYNAHLQLAITAKDRETSMNILKKMLPAMKKQWQLPDCPLYSSLDAASSPGFLSARLADSLRREFRESEGYAFLREDPEAFGQFMREIQD